MIRAAFVLIAVTMVAAGVGWLGEKGFPPLVVVHQGEQVVVRGPGEREAVYRDPGTIALRPPLLSRATIVDTRWRVSDLGSFALAGGEGSVALQLWWRVSDARDFLRASQATSLLGEGQGAPMLERLLAEPFERTLGEWSLKRSLAADVALEDALLATARSHIDQQGVELASLRVGGRAGGGLSGSMRVLRAQQRDQLRREVVEAGPRRRAEARRESAQIESSAQRDAEVLRGQAEAEAARIYAAAHGAAPEFFAFTRQLEAYRNTLGPDTTLVLSPDHPFFRLLSPSAPVEDEAR